MLKIFYVSELDEIPMKKLKSKLASNYQSC